MGWATHWQIRQTGLSSRESKESEKKFNTNNLAKAKVDGPKDLPKKVEIGEHRYKPGKKGMREGMDPSPVNKKERHDLPAILRR